MKVTTGFKLWISPAFVLALGCGPDAGMMDPATRGDGTEPSLASQRFSAWSEPVNLTAVNSSVTDFTPEISDDGLSLYFASNRPGGFPGGSFNDLWVTRRACTDMDKPKCAWGTPVNLGTTVNGSSNDAAPHLSRNGHLLFFNSIRPEGFGSADVYVSRRQCTDPDNPRCGWETPVNLGSSVNTNEFEGGPAIFGAELYFNRGNTPGATPVGNRHADIYMSRIEGEVFGTPVLVKELSSGKELSGDLGQDYYDQRPTIRSDGREIFLSSDRPGPEGMGGQDIWVSTRQHKDDVWSTPLNLGAPINTRFEDQLPSISADGTTLFFASRRPSPGEDCSLLPNGVCDQDLYVTTRKLLEQD
jgi:hypothetical protein